VHRLLGLAQLERDQRTEATVSGLIHSCAAGKYHVGAMTIFSNSALGGSAWEGAHHELLETWARRPGASQRTTFYASAATVASGNPSASARCLHERCSLHFGCWARSLTADGNSASLRASGHRLRKPGQHCRMSLQRALARCAWPPGSCGIGLG
jgi:hypothetical protein